MCLYILGSLPQICAFRAGTFGSCKQCSSRGSGYVLVNTATAALKALSYMHLNNSSLTEMNLCAEGIWQKQCSSYRMQENCALETSLGPWSRFSDSSTSLKVRISAQLEHDHAASACLLFKVADEVASFAHMQSDLNFAIQTEAESDACIGRSMHDQIYIPSILFCYFKSLCYSISNSQPFLPSTARVEHSACCFISHDMLLHFVTLLQVIRKLKLRRMVVQDRPGVLLL